jgi:hypothetical protein
VCLPADRLELRPTDAKIWVSELKTANEVAFYTRQTLFNATGLHIDEFHLKMVLHVDSFHDEILAEFL